MGLATSQETFEPSVSFVTTSESDKHTNEARFPAVGAHSGAWEEARPGCTVRRVLQLERDLRGTQTANGTSRLKISKHVSASGILRTRRTTV